MAGTYDTKLSATKAPTRGGSVNRHTRAERYCYCDGSYGYLDAERKAHLVEWWKKISEKPIVSMTPHSVLMKVCLKYMEEYSQYLHFSYVSRYRVVNSTDTDCKNSVVTFGDVETYQADGQDVLAFLLLQKTTVKNRITYDPLMIDIRLVNDTSVKGQTDVTIPFLQQGASCLVDLYSYYRPVA